MNKYLGKISSAEFGTYSDMPFLMGLQLCFEFDGYSICDGGKYTNNLSYRNKEEVVKYTYKQMNELQDLLEAAKVKFVSELVGKPVEIEVENQSFKDFRILTEVL